MSPGHGRTWLSVPAGGYLGGVIELCVPVARLGLLTSPFGAVTLGCSEPEARVEALGALIRADDAAGSIAARRTVGSILTGWPSWLHFDATKLGGVGRIVQLARFVTASEGVFVESQGTHLTLIAESGGPGTGSDSPASGAGEGVASGSSGPSSS